MKKKTVIEFYGSQVAVADVLGITKSAVNQWPEDVPEGKAYRLQEITMGRLKVHEIDSQKAPGEKVA